MFLIAILTLILKNNTIIIVKQKLVMNWSGGKDSAFCLDRLLQANEYDIHCLLTTISQPYQRISMHGVRIELLQVQAARIGLPLLPVSIPEMPTMETYESVMEKTLLDLKLQGVTTAAFGDIFLEDLRQYREDKLAAMQIKVIFPIWKIPTQSLIKEFIDKGYKAIVTCVNDACLDKSFAGRIIDYDFVKDLPPNVDPCGENGEFHSFVFDAPYFSSPIPFEKGEVVYKKYTSSQTNTDSQATPFDNGFWYCDLLPVEHVTNKMSNFVKG